MRRPLIAFAMLLAATAAVANPYYLDRAGVLWKASSSENGLVLIGERNGEIVVSSLVPFPFGGGNTRDEAIQVVSDELTGKVVVTWQRVWSESSTDVMMAVWENGRREAFYTLGSSLGANPRHPTIRLSGRASRIPDPAFPDDPTRTVEVRDSFAHVTWAEGAPGGERVRYAALRLTADDGDESALTLLDLDMIVTPAACSAGIPADDIERPLFVSASGYERAMVFFGSQLDCRFHLISVDTPLEPPSDDPLIAIGQRRRHVPVFGLKRSYEAPRELSLEGVRMVLGSRLEPVIYRVRDGVIEYAIGTESGWTEIRRLPVREGLSIDQAIPLVEDLAR